MDGGAGLQITASTLVADIAAHRPRTVEVFGSRHSELRDELAPHLEANAEGLVGPSRGAR
jgi:hypothetical protein